MSLATLSPIPTDRTRPEIGGSAHSTPFEASKLLLMEDMRANRYLAALILSPYTVVSTDETAHSLAVHLASLMTATTVADPHHSDQRRLSSTSDRELAISTDSSTAVVMALAQVDNACLACKPNLGPRVTGETQTSIPCPTKIDHTRR